MTGPRTEIALEAVEQVVETMFEMNALALETINPDHDLIRADLINEVGPFLAALQEARNSEEKRQTVEAVAIALGVELVRCIFADLVESRGGHLRSV